MTTSQTSTHTFNSPWTLGDERLTPFLDDVEERLPAPADHLFGLQRSMTRLGVSVMSTAVRTVGSSMEKVIDTGRTGVRTVTGQARSAIERTVDTGKAGTKEVLGQARAQTERTVATAETEVDGLTSKVEMAGSRQSFTDWTKADLYTRAQELEIEGRAGMDKTSLIAALVDHDTV